MIAEEPGGWLGEPSGAHPGMMGARYGVERGRFVDGTDRFDVVDPLKHVRAARLANGASTTLERGHIDDLPH